MNSKSNKLLKSIQYIFITLLMVGCSTDDIEIPLVESIEVPFMEEESDTRVEMEVTATAYNSVESQTKKGDPFLAAWGDILEPGERAIAVSRDLIKEGLDHNEEVDIKGLNGTYIVKDKMNKRWKKKIDIYVGLDLEAALEWGKKDVIISFDTVDRPNDKFSRIQEIKSNK